MLKHTKIITVTFNTKTETLKLCNLCNKAGVTANQNKRHIHHH